MSLQSPRLVMPPFAGLMHRLFGRARPTQEPGEAAVAADDAWSTASVPSGVRVYAVGDVHGRADLLARLFERIDADRAAAGGGDSVEILLGDYVDRGPESREVIDMLVERERTTGAVCLLGNHEDMLLKALEAAARMPDWLNNGGRETLISYGIAPSPSKSVFALHAELNDVLPDAHRAFLQRLRLSHTCGDYFFVHAGVDPAVPLDQQRAEDMLWIRDRFLGHRGRLGKVVVHGHTPRMRPEVGGSKINLDTGAYITGTLTCLVLEGERRRLL